MTGSGPTPSPVKADPFVGLAQIPTDLDLSRSRIMLDLDEITPEAAAPDDQRPGCRRIHRPPAPA